MGFNEMKSYIKRIAKRYGISLPYICGFFKGNITLVNKGNLLRIKGAYRTHTSVNIRGNGNLIEVDGNSSLLDNCSFYISGNNNTIHIGSNCQLHNVSFYIEDSNGMISIGENTNITGNTHFAAIEGTSITIGRNCFFSQNITFRTGDSHSILDLEGHRINPSDNIVVGNHVWISNSVTLLKGTQIGNNSIIATGSIITSGKYPSNSILGGIGGRILKSGINWRTDRIPFK